MTEDDYVPPTNIVEAFLAIRDAADTDELNRAAEDAFRVLKERHDRIAVSNDDDYDQCVEGFKGLISEQAASFSFPLLEQVVSRSQTTLRIS